MAQLNLATYLITLALQDKASKDVTTSLSRMQKTAEGLKKEFGDVSVISSRVDKTFGETGKETRTLTSILRTMDGQYIQLNQTQKAVFDSTGKIVVGYENVSQSTKVLGNLNKDLIASFVSLASRALLTIPVWFAIRAALSAMASSIKATTDNMADLDDAIRKSQVVLDPFERTTKSAEELRSIIQEIARTRPVSTATVGNTIVDIQKAGLPQEEAQRAARAAIDLVVAGQVEQETATKALILTNSLLGASLDKVVDKEKKFAFIASLFNEVSKDSRVGVKEILNTFVDFLPTAQRVNLTWEQMLKLILAVNEAGFEGAKGATILNRVFDRETSRAKEIRNLLGRDLDSGDAFKNVIDLFKEMNKLTGEFRDDISNTILGEKGNKANALANNLQLLDKFDARIKQIFSDPNTSSEKIAKDAQIQADSIKSNFQEIGTSIGQIGNGIFKWVTGANDFNAALIGVKGTLNTISGFLNKPENKKPTLLSAIFTTPLNSIIKTVAGVRELNRLKKQQIALEEEVQKKAAEAALTDDQRQEIAREAARSGLSPLPTGSGLEGTALDPNRKEGTKVLIQDDLKQAITQLNEAQRLRREDRGNLDKTVAAQNRLNVLIRDYVKNLGFGKVNAIELHNALRDGNIEQLIRGKQLNKDQQEGLKDLIKAQDALNEQRNRDFGRYRNFVTQKQLQDLDNLRVLGFSEVQLSALRIELLKKRKASEEEIFQAQLQHLQILKQRSIEVANAISGELQTSLESLLKNEISPNQFAQNIGNKFQDLSIQSSAKILNQGLSSLGFGSQFGDALSGLETNNPIANAVSNMNTNIGSKIDTTNQLLSGQKSGFASAIPGAPGAAGGTPNLLEGLLGKTGAGVANAGITGILSGLAASKRGGAAGVLGGAGGFLQSLSGVSGIAGALGPLAGIAPFLGPVGAALGIASFFFGRKKQKQPDQFQEQLISISPKIDVTNKKLDIVNRNLVALRTVMEAYVLPQSSYYSESRNVSDQFSLYARRGLVA